MRFDRVRLRNFKPYEDVDLRLREGVTVIHGLNGSGKSSLLEACFFALYGSKALDGTLDDVVTTGEEEAEIELWFTHDDGEYHIERRLRATGERTQTAKCVLEGPNGTIEGARDVRRRVTELLRMDAEAFVNCAYVRQGEVNKLINATPGARQDMIDDLLQLGKLEEYRERAREARLGVNDVLADRRGGLSELESQIEQREERNLHECLNAAKSDLKEINAEVERFESQREKARRTREDARAVLDAYEEKREELDSLAEEIGDLEGTISETERERDGIRESVGERRDRIDELESEIESLLAGTDLETADAEVVSSRLSGLDERREALSEAIHEAKLRAQALETQAENLGSKADDLAERAREKRERAAELERTADEDEASLADDRERIADIEEGIAAAKGRFDGAPVEFGDAEAHREHLREKREALGERRREIRTELDALRRRIEEAEELLDAGKCPECGQAVDGSPHVDGVDGDRERATELESTLSDLDDDLESVESDLETAEALVEAETEVATLERERENRAELLDEREAAVEEKREQAATLGEEATELDADAEEKREAAETQGERAAEVREGIADDEDELESVRERRERLESVRERRESIEEVESEIERLRERRENLRELNDERRERLAEKRERRTELEAAVDDDEIEAARENRDRAEQYLEQVGGKLAELTDRRDEVQATIGGVESELEELERLRGQRETLRERVEALESLHEETDELEQMYGDLRAELRQRNVRTLERMLNETFDLVYGNDAYSHIRLDGEYELTVFQKDGTALAPDQLSGGERALFNLSLRTAIYRLLGEGIDGAAPLPPLILDEPTVFLDSGHVSRLVGLVEEMRNLGVRQIVIVSHDDELVGAADDLVRDEKNPTSNRSHVDREAKVDPGALVDAQ